MAKKVPRKARYPKCKRLLLTEESTQLEYNLAVYLSALGSLVYSMRNQSNMDQADFSKFLGFSQSQLSCIENGGVDVRFSTLLRIAMKLDLDIHDLIVTKGGHAREAWRTGGYGVKRKPF